MSEYEKMVSGELYNPSDPDLVEYRRLARTLAQRFNAAPADDAELREELLKTLLCSSPHLPFAEGPLFFDYGRNTYCGERVYLNFNFTCLDVCPVRIGDNVMFGPNVTLATPMHPLVAAERNLRTRSDGSTYSLEYGRPITIEADCWIAADVVVCGGATVGAGTVIGAGSVVTKDIPPLSLAAGNPCRVIREITDADRMG